jgi:hypothetical protein
MGIKAIAIVPRLAERLIDMPNPLPMATGINGRAEIDKIFNAVYLVFKATARMNKVVEGTKNPIIGFNGMIFLAKR